MAASALPSRGLCWLGRSGSVGLCLELVYLFQATKRTLFPDLILKVLTLMRPDIILAGAHPLPGGCSGLASGPRL